MVSGVGPASHLSEHGIPVVADLSGVGSHLMDHLVVDLHFKDTSNTGLWFLKGSGFSAKMKLIKALLEYKYTQKGPLTTNVTSLFLSRDSIFIWLNAICGSRSQKLLLSFAWTILKYFHLRNILLVVSLRIPPPEQTHLILNCLRLL